MFNVKAALSSLVMFAAVMGTGCGVTTEEEAPASESREATLEAEKKKCDYKDPTVRYVSRDPAECQLIFFVCNPGETTFFNECGCGCVLPQ